MSRRWFTPSPRPQTPALGPLSWLLRFYFFPHLTTSDWAPTACQPLLEFPHLIYILGLFSLPAALKHHNRACECAAPGQPQFSGVLQEPASAMRSSRLTTMCFPGARACGCDVLAEVEGPGQMLTASSGSGSPSLQRATRAPQIISAMHRLLFISQVLSNGGKLKRRTI